jgi:hypothetical protein
VSFFENPVRCNDIKTKVKKRKQPDSLSSNVLNVGLFLLLFAGPASFAGAIIGPVLGKQFVEVDIAWWQGLIGGVLVGSVCGVVGIAKGKRRPRRNYSDAPAAITSDSKQESSNAKNIEDQILLLMEDVDCDFDVLKQRSSAEKTLALGVLTLQRRATGSSTVPHRAHDHTQTALYMENKNLDLPDFSLRPRIKSMQVLGNLITGTEISFEDKPEFSSRYALLGLETRVQALFGEEIKDLLYQQPIWEIHASGKRMILFVPKREYHTDEEKVFTKTATKITQLFEKRCLALQADGTLGHPVNASEIEAEVEKLGGPLAGVYKRDFKKNHITRDEVRGFSRQATPRSLPEPLLHQTRSDPFLLFVGGFLALAAIVMSILSQKEPDHLVLFILISSFLFLFSGAAIFFASYFPWRRRWILRNGAAIPGVITKVESTGFINGNERMYRCYVSFNHSGKEFSNTCWIDSKAAQRAQSIVDTGQPTTILADPAKPQHCLLPELIAMV